MIELDREGGRMRGVTEREADSVGGTKEKGALRIGRN